VTHRSLRFSAATSLAVTAAVSILTAALWWPSPDAVVTASTDAAKLVQPADEPTGPVEITGVATSVTWADSSIPPVRVEVINHAQRPVTAKVWWLLAAPDQTRPWQDPRATSRTVTVKLASSGTTTVVVPGPRRVPTGAWSLSLWAHTVTDPHRTKPSHGVAVTPTVNVLPTDPDVYRLTEPGPHAALGVVEPVGRLAGLPDASGPDALVSVSATTSEPVQVQLRCYLARPGTAEPWTRRHPIGSYVTAQHIEPGVPESMGCRFADLPRHGTWQLSAFLRLPGADGRHAHEDGLYARRPVTPKP
jgi:hypothetical protein